AQKRAALHRQGMEAFERDLVAGAPPVLLAEGHAHFLFPADTPDFHRELPSLFRMLNRAGVRLFRSLQHHVALQKGPLPVSPTARGHLLWCGGVGYGGGKDSALLFDLPRCQRVYAIRLTFAYENPPENPVSLRLSWKRDDQSAFPQGKQTVEWTLLPKEGEKAGAKTVTLWVNDSLDQIRIGPDTKPFVFHLSAIVLLVPQSDE